MDDIVKFFDTIYREMIDLDHLDAIHEIAKRMRQDDDQCRAYEVWYATTNSTHRGHGSSKRRQVAQRRKRGRKMEPVAYDNTVYNVEINEFFDADCVDKPHHYDFCVAQDWDNAYGIDTDQEFTPRQLEKVAYLVSSFYAAGIIAGTNFIKSNIRTALGL